MINRTYELILAQMVLSKEKVSNVIIESFYVFVYCVHITILTLLNYDLDVRSPCSYNVVIS